MAMPLNTVSIAWAGGGDADRVTAVYDMIADRFAASASADMVETIAWALTELCGWYGAAAAALAGPGRATLARNAQGVPVALDTVLPAGRPLDAGRSPTIWHWRRCAIHDGARDFVLLGWQGRSGDGLETRIEHAFHPALLQRVARLIGAGSRRAGQSEARREVLRRLSETQRLDVASTTALAMAHNLNNVLAAMLGHTEIALEALRDQPRGHGAVMAIKNASERASELIEGILGLGERDVAEALLSLGQLCRDTIALIRPAIPSRIALELHDTTDGAQIAGKAAQLQQVLLNLIRNAAQAIPGQGRISIDVSAQPCPPGASTQVGTFSDGAYLVLRVADDGVGIAAEARGTIFRPFVTTRPSGTGLGLSAVAQIVCAHEGAIRLVAPESGGSMFEVWLPARAAHDDAEPGQETRGDGRPVLLIARLAVRERFEDLVAALGYEPHSLQDMSQAITFLQADGAEPCPVMMYTEQPDLDACLAEAEWFRIVCPGVPLTMLVPGRMPATPFGGYAVPHAWLAGADNSSAIATCVRLMTDVVQDDRKGMIN